MTLYIPSITIDQAIDALASYIALFTQSPIIRGNVNRTAMPLGSFVELTEVSDISINKPIEIINNDSTETISEHLRLDVQIDFFGWDLSEAAKAFHASFRTIWATTQFPDWISPLYCNNPMKMPIENAENQYEQRWTMTASLQYNPDVIVTQESFINVGDAGVIPADVIYN